MRTEVDHVRSEVFFEQAIELAVFHLLRHIPSPNIAERWLVGGHG